MSSDLDEHVVDQENLKLAKDTWDKIMDTDWFRERPKEVQELYIKFPPWKFYTDKQGMTSRRVYGISEYSDGLRLEVASGMIMITNLVIGGVKPDDLIPVEKYPNTAYDRLMLNPGRESFLKPLGFTDFIGG